MSTANSLPSTCLTPEGRGAEPVHLRPTVARRPTSQILSYYHSADAGRTYIPPGQDHSPPDSPSSSYSDFGERFPDNDGAKSSDEIVYARRKCGEDNVGAVGTVIPSEEQQQQRRASDSPLQHTPLRSPLQQHTPTSAQLSTPPLSSVSCSTPSSAASPRLRTPASREFAPPSSFDLNFQERTVAKPGQHRRRTSSRSLGAADKRRIAIVEMDGSADESAVLSDGVDRDITESVTRIARSLSNNTTASSASSGSSYSYSYFDAQTAQGLGLDQLESGEARTTGSLRARRGFVGTFALVAPPDASPSAYTDFTPPLTAPPGVQFSQYQFQQPVRDASGGPAPLSTHLRSKSEASGAISVNTSSNTASSVASSSTASSRSTRYDIKASPRSAGPVEVQKQSVPMGDTCHSHSSATDLAARTPERHARAQAQLDAAQAQLQPSSLQSPALSQTSSPAAARNGNGTTVLSSSPSMSVDTLQHHHRPTRSPRIDGSLNVVVEQSHSRATTANAPSSKATNNSAAPAPTVATSYLYYQPGVHASAGPLPSPPRQIFPQISNNEPPPPRPPRLHTPAIGNPALAKRSSDTSIKKLTEQHIAPSITPSTTTSTLVNSSHESGDDKKIISEEPVKSAHTREGAFPLNSVIVTDAIPPHSVAKEALSRRPTMDELVKDLDHAIEEAANRSTKENVPPAPSGHDPHKKASTTNHALSEKGSARDLKRPKSRPVLELRREESRSTFRPEQLSRSPSSNYSDDEAADISKPLPDPHSRNRSQVFMSPQDIREESPQRPQSPHKLFDFAKRFSALPRPPSRMSLSKSSNRSNVSSTENIPPERPSSFENTPTQNKVRKHNTPKTLSAWPGAMNFNDVLVRRTPLERSLAYARKINELANYDSGLGDWVVMTRHNLTTSGNTTKRVSGSPLEPRSPSDRTFAFKPRHPSRGSIGSEMTFPKRPDAYVATDLLAAASQEPAPQGPPPTLPYPTLAQGVPPHLSANRSIGLGSPSVRSTSSRTIGGGGFFASIGRKTSTKRDRGADVPPNKLISKRAFAAVPPPPAPDPRPVQLSASPSLPGGPRAPPGRMQRAQSVITQKTSPSSSLLPGPGSAHGHGNAESENEAIVVSRRASAQRAPSAMVSRSATLPQSSTDAQNLDTQIARLADILPTARRDILAGYLTRAGGQEMLALGRYLDDEKNGLLPKT